MSLHLECEASLELNVVTEFGHGGVLISLVESAENGTYGVKIRYLKDDVEAGSVSTAEEYEDMLDNRFSQILSFPTFDQAHEVFQALRARPKQCTCGA